MAPEKLRAAIEALGPVFVQTYAGTEPGFLSCLRKQDHVLDDPAALARLGSAGRSHNDIAPPANRAPCRPCAGILG
ncbi:hypothetical protein [Nocardia sp. NBC_01388]|uniref:hypothetical protein n=1 Tax=Nocardia sp. NBC_01388 TaxID=2903596 RepID=UPI00324B441F